MMQDATVVDYINLYILYKHVSRDKTAYPTVFVAGDRLWRLLGVADKYR